MGETITGSFSYLQLSVSICIFDELPFYTHVSLPIKIDLHGVKNKCYKVMVRTEIFHVTLYVIVMYYLHG